MAKVTSKGQITIPIAIRKKLGVSEGDKLLFIDRPDGVMIINPTALHADLTDEQPCSPQSSGVASTAGISSESSIQAQTDKTESPSKGFSAAALLDEIRSIGSKI